MIQLCNIIQDPAGRRVGGIRIRPGTLAGEDEDGVDTCIIAAGDVGVDPVADECGLLTLAGNSESLVRKIIRVEGAIDLVERAIRDKSE